MLLLLCSNYSVINLSFGAYMKAPLSPTGPTVKDDNLVVEKITDGLDIPTSMAFLAPNDLLVTEKETGKVVRIVNGQIQEEPVLDVPVASSIERGLLGIAISKSQLDGKTYVFLSHTESGNDEDGSDVEDDVEPEGNRLYRYEYVNGQLINPILLLDLTAIPPNDRGEHNGGKIRIGPDNNIYFIVGEVGGHRTQAQNIEDGPAPNGLGGVLRITQDGQIVPGEPIFGDELPLNLYYAMGIRNSFGMDFDPVTGNLWDTENGPATGDEINMVYPGFNSGWALIQGLSQSDLLGSGATSNDLVYFGNASYAEPKLSWVTPIGITALKFLNSDKLGKQYENNMFVGDINNGLLYRFILNEARDDLTFDSGELTGNISLLADREVNDPKENQPFVFGQGFGGITDIEVSPDGYLYVLSYTGSLFRIVPASSSSSSSSFSTAIAGGSGGAEGGGGGGGEEDNTNGNSIPAVILGLYGDRSYSPNPITIEKGQTVTWYNGDTISHSVTSGQDDDEDAGEEFDSKAIIPNQYFSITFEDSGVYPYYCFYHPSMVGEVIVE
ncbi:Soluble aldose sugar dehydrogenase YliI [Candidatus Nitrosocosmicus franklandus]|uniref:Soluble aldose sugar dehydrogenase YliI n=2 Tax=Candidatus Nitrosocosmicus franklandianus TaxID=1798806 RepID=A0A484IC03_9ARCH|nr:Soluble aldose sugar dehydrogenase YliI [Candidatus Nitrosocosmicus franklandus]